MERRVRNVSRRPVTNQTIARRPVGRRRRRNTARRILRFSLFICLILTLVTATIVGTTVFRSKTIQTAIRNGIDGSCKPENAFPGRDEITFLALGRDVDRDNHGNVLKTNGRTDAIMLIKLDFKQKTANILSIPRDTRVRIPGYRGRHKINAAHAYGGPELTIETVDDFLGVRADDYVAFNYNCFEQAIDKLGGLKVNVAKEMNYDDNWGNLHIHLKPGEQTLDGYKSMGFVRFRHSNDGIADTDQERIARQQQFLMAMKSKIVSPSAFFALPDIIETVRGGVNSSMKNNQLMAIASFVKSLPSESIHMVTLPSEEGRSYVRADEDEATKIVNEMFKS